MVNEGPESRAVYEAGTLYEAQLVLDLLTEAGIGAALHNENLIGMLGGLPEHVARPTVWVNDARDWSRAREVVALYEQRKSADIGEDVRCPSCGEMNPGNFELCWKCREPLEPEAGT